MTTNPTSGAADLPEALRSIQRFEVVDCIDDKHVPAVIPKPHGPWVRYEDHIAALAGGQATAAQQPGAAGLIGALKDAQQAINSMKVEAETAAQGDEQMILEACETISNEGLQADTAIRVALASHGQAPAGAGMGHTDGGRNMFYEGRFDGESQREQQARLRWANDMRAAFERHTGNGWFDKDWRTETGLWSSAWYACLAAQPTTTAQAAPAYKDSTPELHIGDSAFENWYSTYSPVHKSDKQRARDAYAAGMGDPLVTAAPAAVAGPGEAVAYLDIGTGGYLDLGTDLAYEVLSRLPKGRHALVIAGTYGIDGYTAAPTTQPASQHQARPVTPYTCPKCSALWLHWPAEQSGFGMDTLNCRSTTHCDYCEKGGVEQLQRLERVPAVLAAPQREAQEPVAVVVPCYTPSGKRVALYSAKQDLPIGTQLYTAPQPSPAAQGDAVKQLGWVYCYQGQEPAFSYTPQPPGLPKTQYWQVPVFDTGQARASHGQVLQIVADYADWLDSRDRLTSFSAFVNEFGYQGRDCKSVYEMVVVPCLAARAAQEGK